MINNIHIINGPNLNFLGIREPEIYGYETFDDIFNELQAQFPNIQFHYFQSNHEGEIIDYLQNNYSNFEGIIINPGALSHYGMALLDALKYMKCPIIEVHLSNIYQREDFRKSSITAQGAKGVITGFGKYSYFLAIQYLLMN